MNVHILDVAYGHLLDGARFYERQSPELGDYFRKSLLEDIERLKVTSGHQTVFGDLRRAVSRKFPFGIYYRIDEGQVWVHGVLDSRRDPAWIRRQLK